MLKVNRYSGTRSTRYRYCGNVLAFRNARYILETSLVYMFPSTVGNPCGKCVTLSTAIPGITRSPPCIIFPNRFRVRKEPSTPIKSHICKRTHLWYLFPSFALRPLLPQSFRQSPSYILKCSITHKYLVRFCECVMMSDTMFLNAMPCHVLSAATVDSRKPTCKYFTGRWASSKPTRIH